MKLGLSQASSISDRLDETLTYVDGATARLDKRLQGPADVNDSNWEDFRTDAGLVLWAIDSLTGWSPNTPTNASQVSVKSRWKE